ncbi:serine hydrolase [[Kitasatospora] papulosa]|uniref:serine hydrolase n=1 Tax=[Kitasatospora] papulosa TaxID=1464011 RepID=UPI00381D6EF7
MVRLALRQPPVAAAEREWSYSNSDYVLAAMIIHRVTGRGWAQEVTRRVIRPPDRPVRPAVALRRYLLRSPR